MPGALQLSAYQSCLPACAPPLGYEGSSYTGETRTNPVRARVWRRRENRTGQQRTEKTGKERSGQERRGERRQVSQSDQPAVVTSSFIPSSHACHILT